MITDDMLKAIEFSVESRIDLESEEQCTIIASAEMVQAIKIAIAQQKIFSTIYRRIVLQENPESTNPYEVLIIPHSMIESAIQQQIKDHLEKNKEAQEKLKVLNDLLGKVDEETLIKISTTSEEKLSEEELEMKRAIQDQMIEVGMNVDLLFSNKNNVSEEDIDQVFNKIANSRSVINLEGIGNEKE